MSQCQAIRTDGEPCRREAISGQEVCVVHGTRKLVTRPRLTDIATEPAIAQTLAAMCEAADKVFQLANGRTMTGADWERIRARNGALRPFPPQSM
jgi:hypothetical protein